MIMQILWWVTKDMGGSLKNIFVHIPINQSRSAALETLVYETAVKMQNLYEGSFISYNSPRTISIMSEEGDWIFAEFTLKEETKDTHFFSSRLNIFGREEFRHFMRKANAKHESDIE